MSSDEDEIEDRFNKAASFVQLNVQSFDKEQLLQFYGYYKQSTVGKCETTKPSWYEMEAKAKWNAWSQLGDLSHCDAMKEYTKLLSKHRPDWDASSSTEKDKSRWISVSCMAQDEDILDIEDKTTFDWIKESDIEMIKSSIDVSIINELDDSGMGLIHWAADRGDLPTIKTLLDFSPDINLLDEGGQTALHYASACGHAEAVKLLLHHGASISVKDVDGLTPTDVALNDEIRTLINQSVSTN